MKRRKSKSPASFFCHLKGVSETLKMTGWMRALCLCLPSAHGCLHRAGVSQAHGFVDPFGMGCPVFQVGSRGGCCRQKDPALPPCWPCWRLDLSLGMLQQLSTSSTLPDLACKRSFSAEQEIERLRRPGADKRLETWRSGGRTPFFSVTCSSFLQPEQGHLSCPYAGVALKRVTTPKMMMT